MLKMNPRVTAFVLLVCLSGILAAHVPHQAVQDSEIFNPMTDDAAADMVIMLISCKACVNYVKGVVIMLMLRSGCSI